MPTEILMPALSPTMEEGKLAKWLVKEGQTIKAGDVIAEIETDKATMEVEASDEGKLGKILVAEGTEGVKVNTPIATLLAEGESEGAVVAAKAPSASAHTKAPSPQPTAASPRGERGLALHLRPRRVRRQRLLVSPCSRRADPPSRDLPWRVLVPGEGNPSERAAAASRTVTGASSPRRWRAGSPRELGVDVGSAQGLGSARSHYQARRGGGAERRRRAAAGQGGHGGRGHAERRDALALAQPMPDDKILALYEKGSYDVVPHDGMRKIIAQRLTLSKQTIPHFYLTVECRIDNLLRAREQVNAGAPKEGPRAFKLSVNDFVIKALGLALAQVPAANVTWTEAGTLRHKYSDVGVAVAIEGGLFTPIIRHAELKSLSEISNEMKDLAERARKRRLAPHEYQGGTTSISNLGMYGIKSFEAVINPPHATILAIGAGEKRAVVVGDKIEVATLMSCTLSGDHRVVDGAVGAELLNALKMLVEEPVRMLV